MTIDEARRGRVEWIVGQLGSVTPTDVSALATATTPRGTGWPADERFWFSGTDGVRLDKADETALRWMWTRLLEVLSVALTDNDPRPVAARRGVMGAIDRLAAGSEDRASEGVATTNLQRAFGHVVWQATIPIWNACCAAFLDGALPEGLHEDLQRPWLDVSLPPLSANPPFRTERNS